MGKSGQEWGKMGKKTPASSLRITLIALGCFLVLMIWQQQGQKYSELVSACARLQIVQARTPSHAAPSMANATKSGTTSCQAVNKFTPPLKTRYDIAALLQQEGMQIGAELGVQHGHFAAETLRQWPGCKR